MKYNYLTQAFVLSLFLGPNE